MKKTLLIAAAASVLLMTGCTGEKEPAPATTKAPASQSMIEKATVEREIAAAEAKYKEVKAMRSIVWRHTKKEIEKAKTFLKNNELEKASHAAKEAYFQSKQAMIQHEEALKVWQNATPQALMQ